VFHRVEERFQIAVHRVTTPQFPSSLHVPHCLMGIAAFAECGRRDSGSFLKAKP
jgi:hypothetical protein